MILLVALWARRCPATNRNWRASPIDGAGRGGGACGAPVRDGEVTEDKSAISVSLKSLISSGRQADVRVRQSTKS